MSDLSHIDPNFHIDPQIRETDIRFYDALEAPFSIHGIFYESGKFRRIPEALAKSLGEGAYRLHTHPAGGRVCFQTDSPYVAIHAKMPAIERMTHIPLTATAGFDLYLSDGEEAYFGTLKPVYSMQDGFESILYFKTAKMRQIVINFPLFSQVSRLHIGLQEDAAVLPPKPYKNAKPVVYYGSSITQGGCASRPGNTYESMVSHRLGIDYINLGFSGNAKGEPEMAEYISRLDMAAFVYDYDHNAPSVEHLQNTHENMFRIIRNAHPQLPIVLMSRPKVKLTEEERQRLEIIRATYAHAKEAGDENVYLLEGAKLMALCGDEGTVDGCHPTDWGFASMAKAVGDLLETLAPDFA